MNLTEDLTLSPEQLHWISSEQAWHYRILPQTKTEYQFDLFCDETSDQQALQDELEMLLGMTVIVTPIASTSIDRLLSKYYLRGNNNGSPVTSALVQGEDFLNGLIADARSLKSSDIHIEAYEHKCRIRIRVDGMMIERHLLEREEYPALVNQIKIMANLDIAEKRLPQDGRIHFNYQEQKFDIRVSVLPTLHGEKVVLRLLNNDAGNIELDHLGFAQNDLQNYLQGVKRPNGILLISGPTGSGKTTTLYATLKLLNKETRNILTIEDPIEYTLEGVNQVQLKESIGLGFGAALRTFLRQDPDVIMVGEIRDTDTANMAIRAALTGHLVLSTIHTNSAWGTVARLIDMGIPPFLVAGTLNTSVAQRLLRLLCPACKRGVKLDKSLYPRQFKPFAEVEMHAVPTGCEECHYTGYKGRKAVYEVIPLDGELAGAVRTNQLQVDALLREKGVQTLAENAFNLFKQQSTSLEEIYSLLFNY